MPDITADQDITSTFSNCCNGKVGAAALAAAQDNAELRQLLMPAGMKLLTPGGAGNVSPANNCCNGKVGEVPM